MNPDRIVIGAQSEHAVDLMKKVYEPFMAPILVTDINSAELIKHAANSFLALKISYINAEQKNRFLKAIRETLWVLRDKKIAVWGLAFKPNTDDIRSSVAIELVADMLKEKAHVTVYDPKAMEKAREVEAIAGAKFADSALEGVEGAEALIIATEWSEFGNVDLEEVKGKMTTPIVFDGRNLFDPETMAKLGFHYHSIGRASVKPG